MAGDIGYSESVAQPCNLWTDPAETANLAAKHSDRFKELLSA